MIIEIAHYGFILSVLTMLVLSLAIFAGFAKSEGNQKAYLKWGNDFIRIGMMINGVLLFFALVILLYAFGNSLFSVNIVWRYSSTVDPFIYKLTSLWGNHEGSVFLWLLFIYLLTVLLYFRKRFLPELLWLLSVGFSFLVMAGIGLYTVLTSNPFLRTAFLSGEGQSLNPLLQDPLFVIHPPLLFLGYAACVFPFALTLASFLTGEFKKNVQEEIKFWAVLSWTILTIAVALGSYWAYYELGWGGWWFWDPVENVSLLPWLISLALIHALITSIKKNIMLGWVRLLSIMGFMLALVGFFLVRSGLMTSVHSFALDPKRGYFIFVLIVILTAISLFCFQTRKKGETSKPTYLKSVFNREMMMIFNAFFLLIAVAVIVLGTFMPLLIEAITGKVVSIGAPYYNKIFGFFLPFFTLTMILGIWLSWQGGLSRFLKQKMILTMIGSVFLIALILGAFGVIALLPSIVLMTAITLFVSLFADLSQRLKIKSFRDISLAYKAMFLGHLGFAIMCFALVFASAYGFVTEAHLKRNQVKSVGLYQMTFTDLFQTRGENYEGIKAVIHYQKDNQKNIPLQPERRYYGLSSIDLAETAIRSSLLSDDMMVLGGLEKGLQSEAVQLRFYHYPLAVWIWLGAVMMACGGILSLMKALKRGKNV